MGKYSRIFFFFFSDNYLEEKKTSNEKFQNCKILAHAGGGARLR